MKLNFGKLLDEIQSVRIQGKRIRKAKVPELYQSIINSTDFLPSSTQIKERIFCVENDIITQQKCEQCSINPVRFLGSSTGYRKFCSCICSGKNEQTLLKRRNTNLKKFGTKTPAESDFIKKKTLDIFEKKYGKGVTCTQQVPEIKKKSIRTFDQKFGGQRKFLQRNIPPDSVKKLNNKKFLYEEHILNKKPIYQLAMELNTNFGVVSRALDSFKIEQQRYHRHSFGERQLVDELSLIYEKPILIGCYKIIPPYEIDIFLPDINLAIEYNGMYWHSELVRNDKYYHINKTNMCKKKNISLLQIWESEWITQQPIVVSMIRQKINYDQEKIYADECNVKEISTKQSADFLNTNHLQGATNSSINIGLMKNDKLVSLMSFRKSRRDRSSYEILRFASILNHTVIGGESKIFKYFVNKYDPSSITAYSNIRYGDDQTYQNLGFILQDNLKPSYHYFHCKDSYKTYPRIEFQKHKLKTKLKRFDPILTEWENMRLNGYNRIWDCGQIKYIWTV